GHSLRAYHGTVLAPYESVMNKAVAAERVQRGQALLAGGVDQLLAGMRPVLRWNFPVLEADYPAARDIYLDGRGLRLVPSFFCWKTPVALVDESLQPVLVYPIAHHSTSLYQDYAGAANPEALANLLGATRAAVLLAVGDGRTTTELAKAA